MKKNTKVLLLVTPLAVSIIWLIYLIILTSTASAGELPAPDSVWSMIRGLSVFTLVYGAAAYFFYSRMQ